MIDTSVLVAGLVSNHQFHDLARPHVAAAAEGAVPGIVLAEAWAALRRGPWNLAADLVERVLEPWSSGTGSWPRRWRAISTCSASASSST